MSQKIVISVNTTWNLYNFRSNLIKALIQHGYQVVALAPRDEYVRQLAEIGCECIHIPMDSNGTHPGRDLRLLMSYLRILQAERPLAYLGYTIKPNVYGSLAAQMLAIPVINNIAGLGTTFINNSILTYLVRMLYRASLRRSRLIFFQNSDDQALFVQAGLVQQERTVRLPGSGLDLVHFQPGLCEARQDRKFIFLLVSRMLKDKGIEEYVAAARYVQRMVGGVEFQLLGSIDTANKNSIPIDQLRQWEQDGVIKYLGKTDDVRPRLAEADCVVLPSYREGVPRSLLEAAAMGRPIIASDAVGCRDVVDDKVNGLLCRVRDAGDLAEKMMDMLNFSPARRLEMGQAGRRKVELQFDEDVVIQKYLQAIGEIADADSNSERNRKWAVTRNGKYAGSEQHSHQGVSR